MYLYRTRRMYTHSIPSIILLFSSFLLAIQGWVFIYDYDKGSITNQCKDTVRVSLTYYHSWMYLGAFLYCVLIFWATVIYKGVFVVLYLKFPKLHHGIFMRKRDEVVEKYIEDFWSHPKK